MRRSGVRTWKPVVIEFGVWEKEMSIDESSCRQRLWSRRGMRRVGRWPICDQSKDDPDTAQRKACLAQVVHGLFHTFCGKVAEQPISQRFY